MTHNSDARQRLFEQHKILTQKAFDIMVVKNNDYACGDDPFANFRKGELFNLCSTEAGILLRITDKISRLATFVNDGKLAVKNESYEDSVLDVINYMVLLVAYTKDKNKVDEYKQLDLPFEYIHLAEKDNEPYDLYSRGSVIPNSYDTP